MSAKKVFFKAFFYSMILISFFYLTLLYLINLDNKTQEADINKEGVAILNPAVDDSKNILIVLEGSENVFFYILNLNGIQNRVSLISIQDEFLLKANEKTLLESFNTAGIMQASFDLSKEFNLSIDYYLALDYNDIINLSKDFNDINIKSISDGMPSALKELLLNSQETIDINSIINLISKGENILNTTEGIGFFNELLFFILRDNIFLIDEGFTESFKDNFSYIQTNINTIAIEKLTRINSFFSLDRTVFLREIILVDDENYLEKIDNIYKN